MRRTALLFSALLALPISAAFADSIQIIEKGSIQLTKGMWIGMGTTPNSFVGDSYFEFHSDPAGSLDFTSGRFRTSNNNNWGIQYWVGFLSNISYNAKTDTLRASFEGVEWGYCGPFAPECIIEWPIQGTFTEHIDFDTGSMGPGFLYSSSPFLTPELLTPEPGTFALMGTGLIGVFGALRQRLWK